MDKPNTSKGKSAEIISLSAASSKKEPHSEAARPSQNDNIYLPRLNRLTSEFEGLREDEGLNKLERTSVLALVAYTAHVSGVDEAVVRSMVETRFGAAEIRAIRRRDYEDAVRFLVDLDVNAAMN